MNKANMKNTTRPIIILITLKNASPGKVKNKYITLSNSPEGTLASIFNPDNECPATTIDVTKANGMANKEIRIKTCLYKAIPCFLDFAADITRYIKNKRADTHSKISTTKSPLNHCIHPNADALGFTLVTLSYNLSCISLTDSLSNKNTPAITVTDNDAPTMIPIVP